MNANYKISWILILIFAIMATLIAAKPMLSEHQADKNSQERNTVHSLDEFSKQLDNKVIQQIRKLIEEEEVRARATGGQSSGNQAADGQNVEDEDPGIWFG